MTKPGRKPQRRGWGWLRQRSSGNWQASYIGPDLMRHHAPLTFGAKMDAEHWLSEEHRMMAIGTWVAPSERVAATHAQAITLAEYAQTWVDQRTLKPRTRIGYQATLDNHILPMLGRVPLRNLSSETVRTWFASLGSDHPTRNAHAYQLLHAVLKTALTDDLIKTNPANLVGVMNPKTKREATIPTVAEVEAIADAIKPERLRTLVLVLAWCGLRWGEAIELRRKDISEGGKAIRIGRAVTHRRDDNGYCRIDTTKSGERRSVIVPPHIRPDLLRHLAENVEPEADALLFSSAQSCHLHERTFRKWYQTAQTAAGRTGVTIHDLRHFAGTMTAQVGTLRETQDRLGHSTVKASMIYQQRVDGSAEKVADALSELARPTPKTAE
jgi:integrase